ncbi:unnamed protein product [Peniophora sp. CBMAI 1063]|nr:unnamed protein product [Peniophora sp. CBMAI 1063]
MPSPEFVSVLRLAGLDEWLEPESGFESSSRNGPHKRFLDDRLSGRSCLEILRLLAKNVNFAAYRAQQIPAFPFMRPSSPDSSTSAQEIDPSSSPHTSPLGLRSVKQARRDPPPVIPNAHKPGIFSTYTQDVEVVLSGITISRAADGDGKGQESRYNRTAVDASTAPSTPPRSGRDHTSDRTNEALREPGRQAERGEDNVPLPLTPVLTDVVVHGDRDAIELGPDWALSASTSHPDKTKI